MPATQEQTDRLHLQLIQKWKKHFEQKGCCHDKVFRLSRKYALKEIKHINSPK